MVYHGHIKDGRIVLDEPADLPEGAAVSVEVVHAPASESEGTATTTLGERLMKLSGIASGFPEDGSVNHDHYIYGTPKRTQSDAAQKDSPFHALLELAGAAKGLTADAPMNHDPIDKTS